LHARPSGSQVNEWPIRVRVFACLGHWRARLSERGAHTNGDNEPNGVHWWGARIRGRALALTLDWGQQETLVLVGQAIIQLSSGLARLSPEDQFERFSFSKTHHFIWPACCCCCCWCTAQCRLQSAPCSVQRTSRSVRRSSCSVREFGGASLCASAAH